MCEQVKQYFELVSRFRQHDGGLVHTKVLEELGQLYCRTSSPRLRIAIDNFLGSQLDRGMKVPS